jgi:hypothetical protein
MSVAQLSPKAGRVSMKVQVAPPTMPVHVGLLTVAVNDEPQQICSASGYA